MTRITSVPFAFNVVGSSSTSTVSNGLVGVKLILEAMLFFPASTTGRLYYRFFQDSSPGKPPTGLPGGSDLFGDEIDLAKFTGENIAYVVPIDKKPAGTPLFLKMYAENQTTVPLIAGAVITIAR